MSNFWIKGLQAVGATGVRAICSLAVQKMMALWFGPVGITMLNHLQNLTALLISIPNDGINRGLTALLPSTLNGNDGRRRKIKLAGLAWHSGILLVSILLLLTYPASFVTVFSRQELSMGTWLLWFILGLAGSFAFSYWCGLRLAEGRVRLYSWVQGLTAVLALAVAGFGIIQGKVEVALLYIMIGQGLGGLVAWFSTLRRRQQVGLVVVDDASENIAHSQATIWGYVKAIGRFGLMAAGVALFGRLTEYLVRLMAISNFNELDIGYWQAVARLSDAYMLPLNTFLTVVIFPVLAMTSGKGPEAWRTIRTGMSIALPIGWAGLVLAWWLRADLMVWLNDIEFVAAAPLVGWQTIGDILRLPSYFFATMLLAQNRPTRFLFLEFMSTAVYVMALSVLLPRYDVTGFVMAHAIRYAVYLPCTLWVAYEGDRS
jgi:PST family polysaccharide transporter